VCVFTTFPGAFDHRPGLRAMLGEVWRSPRLLGAALSFVMLDRRIARRLSVPRLKTPMAIVKRCRGDLNIVMTSANIHTSPAHPASDYHYVGPCVRAAGISDGSPLPARDNRPLVYISLGTCFYRRPEFYRACVEAFSDGAYQVLLAAGASFADCCFERLPTHIHVRDRVDQIAALAQAAVFVTHGGMNSVSESLFAGVPMVVFPQAVDQFALARYVAANGSGRILQPEDVTGPEPASWEMSGGAWEGRSERRISSWPPWPRRPFPGARRAPPGCRCSPPESASPRESCPSAVATTLASAPRRARLPGSYWRHRASESRC
jgi:hypothetical protein